MIRAATKAIRARGLLPAFFSPPLSFPGLALLVIPAGMNRTCGKTCCRTTGKCCCRKDRQPQQGQALSTRTCGGACRFTVARGTSTPPSSWFSSGSPDKRRKSALRLWSSATGWYPCRSRRASRQCCSAPAACRSTESPPKHGRSDLIESPAGSRCHATGPLRPDYPLKGPIPGWSGTRTKLGGRSPAGSWPDLTAALDP
jgi:hypothetical protein